MSTYTLTYFHGRGRGELPRWVLAAAGQQFQDNRIDFKDWPTLRQTTPFGGLPILETDGVTLAQTSAIALFLAKRFKLVGRKDTDEARIHMIMECVSDMRTSFYKTLFGEDEAKANAQKKWDAEDQNQFLSKFEKLLGSKEFFVADQITLADIAVAELLNNLSKVDWKSFPGLAANKGKVKDNSGIAKWLSTRPQSDF